MRPSHHTTPLRLRIGSFALAAVGVPWMPARAGEPAPVAQPPAAAASGPAADAPRVVPLSLETSDGVDLKAWFYPPLLPADDDSASSLATVILLHDLAGSHRAVDPLARGLQAARCAVVAPDLRGHGESRRSRTRSDEIQSRSLQKPDFEIMAAARGGQMRDQSAVRGDVEVVRNWIVRKADEGGIEPNRLFVVGSGLGASIALGWTAEDWAWPPLVTGPQGRTVRGLVLLSPSWTTRGFSIGPLLGGDAMKHGIPVMIIAGRGDRDTERIYDTLRRSRPQAWWEHREGKGPKPEARPKAGDTLLLLQYGTEATGDALAVDGGVNATATITGFFNHVLARPREGS